MDSYPACEIWGRLDCAKASLASCSVVKRATLTPCHSHDFMSYILYLYPLYKNMSFLLVKSSCLMPVLTAPPDNDSVAKERDCGLTDLKVNLSHLPLTPEKNVVRTENCFCFQATEDLFCVSQRAPETRAL